MVFVWDSNLSEDSNPPRRINHPPSRIPRSFTIIWPLRWLVVGLQVPSHHTLCPTYKLAVSGYSPKKVNPASGALLWTCRLLMGLVLMMVSIGMNFPCTTFTWTNMIAKHGPGALMAKFDVEAAHRNIAVHPDDRYLLGMTWRGQFLWTWPSHLASANNSPIIRKKCRVADLIHNLDDFITADPAYSLHCSQNLPTIAGCLSFT